ncbi:MAG: hypothetical protein II705_04400, partial [Clostridia bacterium]|nr:hypothetical protein [Clostridia bacterium]
MKEAAVPRERIKPGESVFYQICTFFRVVKALRYNYTTVCGDFKAKQGGFFSETSFPKALKKALFFYKAERSALTFCQDLAFEILRFAQNDTAGVFPRLADTHDTSSVCFADTFPSRGRLFLPNTLPL